MDARYHSLSSLLRPRSMPWAAELVRLSGQLGGETSVVSLSCSASLQRYGPVISSAAMVVECSSDSWDVRVRGSSYR
jgi:hypothetical protein